MPKPYTPRDLDKAEPMRAVSEAAEAIKRIDALADEMLAVATSVSSREGRMQVLTRLAMLTSVRADIIAPLYDADGNLVSDAAPLPQRVANARFAEFEAANTDPDARMSFADIAQVTGLSRGSVQGVLKHGRTPSEGDAQ